MPHRPMPPFDTLVARYPHTETVTQVKKLIGGAADDFFVVADSVALWLSNGKAMLR